MNKRLFIGIGIRPDGEFGRFLSALKEELKDERIRWTKNTNLHITLAFPGSTDEALIPHIGTMLEEKCRDFGRFEIIIRGIGVFRNVYDPKVIWAGIDPSEKLGRLHHETVKGLSGLGITTDEKIFSPHLTLGRIKHIDNKDNLKVLILKYHGRELLKSDVKDLTLYESVLKQDGPEYLELKSCRL